MTGPEFAGYALLALLSLGFACGLAIYQYRRFVSSVAKVSSWVVPAGGAIALTVLLYTAYGTDTGGFPLFHFGILGAGCQILAAAIPVLQTALLLIARKLDR